MVSQVRIVSVDVFDVGNTNFFWGECGPVDDDPLVPLCPGCGGDDDATPRLQVCSRDLLCLNPYQGVF